MPKKNGVNSRSNPKTKNPGRVIAPRDECVNVRKQQDVLSLFGTIDYDPGYDYKRERRKR